MAASYDGDGNRVFQISRKEVEQYVEKADASNSADAKDSHESSKDSTHSPAENEKGLIETVQAEQAATKTYYEKVYADPAETIFWYGFGQGIMHFVGNINSALSAYLSDWFCHAWDFITGQYELALHSENGYIGDYSEDDIEAMRRAGLTEEDIAEILGIEVVEDSKSVVEYTESGNVTQPTSDEKASVSESVVIPENPDEKIRVDYELTYYVNDVNTENTQVLMEYGKRDELKSVYTYGNERISAEIIADTYNPQIDDFETDYYLYDGRGSVTQVLNSSEIVESYTYDPFGNVTSGAPDFDNFYGYNAEDTNPVTGLQYLRARYYDTEDGRFSVADTYLGDVSDPLTLNRYSYTVNNPVMQSDPSGHWPKWLDKATSAVKKGVSKIASWASENIVKPVVNTVKSVATWVNDNVIQPIKNTVSDFKDGVTSVGKKIQQGYQNIIDKTTQQYRKTTEYIEKRTAEIKQKIIEFSCGTAKKIGAQIETQLNNLGVDDNTISTMKFGIQHPIIAIQIGQVQTGKGVTNISTNATRFANAFEFEENDSQEGSEVNAFRHAVWITTITNKYGQDIALQVGNAHENNADALDGITDIYNHSFDNLSKADEAIDLMNNSVARELGKNIDKQDDMKGITKKVLEYFYSKGLNVAVKQDDGTYKMELRKISEEEYEASLKTLDTLDINGFPPDSEYYKKK